MVNCVSRLNFYPGASASLRSQIPTEKSISAVPGRFASSDCEEGALDLDDDNSPPPIALLPPFTI